MSGNTIRLEVDTIIVGGGACGLMCAVQAGMLGKKTLLIERNSRVGAKILISGGGRCNYTNLYTGSANFVSQDAGFAEPVLSEWSVDDTVVFFEKYGIRGAEKTLGQLFPADAKAKDVVAIFERLIRQYGQELLLDTEVGKIERIAGGGFEVYAQSPSGVRIFRCRNLVLASGGLPVAKLGASDLALRIARQLGLEVVETAPALVPLAITGKDAEWYAALTGNSIYSRVFNKEISFEENILFTHWGLSGPAILQISSYWQPGQQFTIDLLPKVSMKQLIGAERDNGGRRLVSQLLNDHFPKRFVDALDKFLPLGTKIASLGKKDAALIEQTIHRFVVKPAGDKGYDKAEVMRGGVATQELDPLTLQSLKVPGLYFGGECVDMTGWLGGYNFQWAWASAYAIAKGLE